MADIEKNTDNDDPFNGLTHAQAQTLVDCRQDDRDAEALMNQGSYAEADALFRRSYDLKKTLLPNTSIELLPPLNGLIICANKLDKPNIRQQWEFAARWILKHHLNGEFDDELSYTQLRERLVKKESQKLGNPQN